MDINGRKIGVGYGAGKLRVDRLEGERKWSGKGNKKTEDRWIWKGGDMEV